MTGEAAWLLSGLLLAHYLGDFTPLATPRMQEAKANGGPLWPIAGHAVVHAALVAAVVALLAAPAWTILAVVATIELVTHFGIDAGRSLLGRRRPGLNDPGGNAFWHALGIDQLAHALVLVGLAAFVL